MPQRETAPHARAREQLNAAIRTLYEDTLVPVREIARLVGVTERNLYLTVRRLGCRPRMRLAPGGGRRLVPLSDAPPAMRGGAGLDAAGVRRAARAIERAVAQQRMLTATVLAERERCAAARIARRQGEADMRALAHLSQARRELARLQAAESARAEARARDMAVEAARTAELRRELARKLANLVSDAQAPDAPATDTPAVQAPHNATGARIRLLSD